MAMRERLYVRASGEDLERWKRAAALAGAESISALVRELLDAQAANVARRPIAQAAAAEGEPDWNAVIRRIARGATAT
jgi:hypothetical protein